MTRKLRSLHGWLLGLTLACPALVHADDCPACGGCDGGSCGGKHSWMHIDNCANIPPGAQPAPNGTYVNRWVQLQAAKAEEDDFVIYKHMWYKNGIELGPLGRYQLNLIAQRLPTVPFPVVIETSKDDALDATRREIIMNLLAAHGFTDPSRVIVAYPQAEFLYGDEAPYIYAGIVRGGLYGFGGGGVLGGFGLLPGGGFNGFTGFGGYAGVGRP